MIFNDFKNVFKKWNINETFVEFPNHLPGTWESDKTQCGVYYSQMPFLKLFGSKYSLRSIFATGQIPTQLATRGTRNLPRQLDPSQFGSATYEAKDYKKKENLLKGIKNWYSQMLGHSHTKARSMVLCKWLFSGAFQKGQPLYLALVSTPRRENNICEVHEKGYQPFQHEGVMILASSQQGMLTKCFISGQFL